MTCEKLAHKSDQKKLGTWCTHSKPHHAVLGAAAFLLKLANQVRSNHGGVLIDKQACKAFGENILQHSSAQVQVGAAVLTPLATKLSFTDLAVKTCEATCLAGFPVAIHESTVIGASISILLAGLQSVQDGTGRAEDGGEGTAAFQGIMSMVHDPTSNTLYIGVSTHH
eukprot:scaffold221453_cov19-Tisochrysis_lutea.AAC.1